MKNTLKIDWSESNHEARISVSDGVITNYATEDDIPTEEISLREIAESYAATYDHNGNDDTYTVAEIEDLTDSESVRFAFDGNGNFEWHTDRDFIHY